MTVAIIWSDGTFVPAETWEALEERIAKDAVQYLSSFEYDGNFRSEMRRRAKKWSRTDIQIDGPSRDFFFELERARMLRTVADASQDGQTSRKEGPVDFEQYKRRMEGLDPAPKEKEA